MGTQVFNLLTGKSLEFEGISYCLNEQCNMPIILIDLEQYRSQLTTMLWSNLLSLTEINDLTHTTDGVVQISIERLTGRLAAKLALAVLTGKSIKQSEILITKSIENFGQPYSACGRYISISHSGRYVIAAASDFAIGVDIQKKRTFSNTALNMAFNAKEVSNKSIGSQTLIWTIKESFLKALGLGIFPYIKYVELKKDAQNYLIETSSTYINNAIALLGDNTQIMTGTLSQYCYSITKIE
ncbi:4'-phosphopantetheinyl transferase family protein [Pseudoalteromonas denitrificans]|uniref:4'-phosphopantetheinyl transferase superfamily protein n=1 Tax=Pseudoalteromonas denitrificans DSM 6059 TaxID=1123010 RepID=A0A1I1G864_9GAMM|nr:4'-phosphopantetheinyl transferase superfamily protein [Pseudoalteromonas denitrificans]SFC05350.1 4'-phosphopantetheinyl transferase superfamily protein [Pseudoalteromonas denitrificans DSM 6059]